MQGIFLVTGRELRSYFVTPIAYIFILVFLVMAGVFTFYIDDFFGRGQADLQAFFIYHPWLYLFLIPAIAMRLWAEERKSGTLELLLTLPISLTQSVVGKFLAAWLFSGLALALTATIWWTVNFLGDPDNGAIITAYLGSWLMAGAYLAIGSCVSALTKNQVVAFIMTLVVCLLFTFSGSPTVLQAVAKILPATGVDIVASLSFITHFEALSKGVIDIRDIIYFVAFIVAWLAATVVVIDWKKAG